MVDGHTSPQPLGDLFSRNYCALTYAPCPSCIRNPPGSTRLSHSWHLPRESAFVSSSGRVSACPEQQQLTCVSQVCRRLIILSGSQCLLLSYSPPVDVTLPLHRGTRLTCLAAYASLGMPQPWRKQLASSKMASTSSPFATPPFFMPALSASSSMDAELDAAAERYLTAFVGSGAQPHPCLRVV